MKSVSPAAPFHWLRTNLGSFSTALAIVGLLATASATCRAAEIRISRDQQGAKISVGDLPFAEYITRSGSKPVVWPVLGPGQLAMTRSYPLDTSKSDEAHDHPHQRSLWFTFGAVNGIDFWAETPGTGHIDHREFVELQGGPQGVIVTRNDWIAPDGRKILEDERRLTFAATDDARTIDFDIVLKATNGAVEFGDTKEGAFGVRVAESIALGKKPKGDAKETKHGGEIKNDRGVTDRAAWAQPAAWVDYHGKVDGQLVGIAIMNHPDSFGYPTRWHVRDYGLFAANPFGSQGFDLQPKGGHTLAAGDTLKLSYRVLLHRGDEQTGGVAASFQAYAGQKRP